MNVHFDGSGSVALDGEDGVLKGTEGTAGDITVDLIVDWSVFVG